MDESLQIIIDKRLRSIFKAFNHFSSCMNTRDARPALPRPWGKWLPRGAPALKIFKTAPPRVPRPAPPRKCPEFNCYPPRPKDFLPAPPCPTPNNFSSALPCPAPKQKKAAPCIPDEHVGLLDQNKRLRMMTFYRPDGLGAQMWPEITCRILLHRHQVNDLGMIRSKKDQRSATRRC